MMCPNRYGGCYIGKARNDNSKTRPYKRTTPDSRSEESAPSRVDKLAEVLNHPAFRPFLLVTNRVKDSSFIWGTSPPDPPMGD